MLTTVCEDSATKVRKCSLEQVQTESKTFLKLIIKTLLYGSDSSITSGREYTWPRDKGTWTTKGLESLLEEFL